MAEVLFVVTETLEIVSDKEIVVALITLERSEMLGGEAESWDLMPT